MKVYLDLDGCITDFNTALHKALDLPISYKDWPYTPGVWDYFPEVPGTSLSDIDYCCNEDFWANMKWMHDGLVILVALEEKYGKENIYLLTCPMPNQGSWTGKYEWVMDNMPDYEKRLIITHAPKWEFAESNTILFDDKDESVNEFRRYGGEAVLVPRPWNSEYEDSWATAGCVRNSIAI